MVAVDSGLAVGFFLVLFLLGPAVLLEFLEEADGSPMHVADGLLRRAVALDQGRPNDDMSVVALAVLPADPVDKTRRLWIRFPVS